MINTSGCTAVTSANASRTVMPDEYVFTGRAIASPRPENATISGSSRAISSRPMPIMLPAKYRFSRPVNSG